jgi:hypothetical protein
MEQEEKQEAPLITVTVILLFTAASVISTNQYRYGISDHAIIIPFLKSFLHSNLYPGDFLLTQKPFYYTYLWKCCALFTSTFNISIPVLFFVGYCASVFFIFLGTYQIAKLLFRKREVGFLALFFLLFSIKSFASGVTIDNMFLTRVASLPLLIFSVYFFLREKYGLSSLLLGAGFLIHPMTAAYFILMQVVALLFSIKFTGIRSVLYYFLILFICSSPILIWKYLHHPSSLHFLNVQPQWLELLRLRSPHHIFPLSWNRSVAMRAGLMLALFFFTWKHKPALYHHRIIKIYVTAILVMCVAGFIFSEFIPLSIVINFQLLRSFIFIYFLAAIYYSNFLVKEFSSGKNFIYKTTVGILSICILYAASGWKYGIAAFLIFSLIQILMPGKPQLKYFMPVLILMVIITAAAIYIKHSDFSINNHQEKEWLDVQLWAKENTGTNDKFIVPPYTEGFRVESERTVYCDWKDGTLMNFNPEFGTEWYRRMQKLGYKKGFSIEDNFSSLTEKDFTSIAEELKGPVLLVTEKKQLLNFNRVYANEKFVVYRVN